MATPPYTNQASLIARFTAERVAQLFSVQGVDGSDSGAIDTDALAATIADAEAEFESIIGPVYPSIQQVNGQWDPIVTYIVSVFAMYLGIARRPEYLGGKGENPYAAAYKHALMWMDEIKSGKRRLMGTTAASLNRGGEILSINPTDTIAPYFYFSPNPRTGEGGSSGF